MNLLYNAGIAALDAAMSVVALRSSKIREMLSGRRDTCSILEQKRRQAAPCGFDVWFHAASLGEFEQGRPLIERLRRERPDIKILLTFYSPSGYRVRKDYAAVDAVCYLPLDSPRQVKRFLDLARPRVAVFIKYEFWGNYLEQLHSRGIPTYIISAIFRPGQIFFRTGGGMFRHWLGNFTRLYVQDDDSLRLLRGIGIDNVTVAGDTRFDRVTDIMHSARPLPAVVERFAAAAPFTLVAGSSWEPDEELIALWIAAHREARLIVAPHEFDDARLDKLARKLGGEAARLSQCDPDGTLPESCRVLIVDCFGLLSSLYRVASAAWIGGGFGSGIHNINEAAVYGIPVVFGPNNSKFREARELIAAGGGFEVTDHATASAILDTLCDDTARREAAGKAAGQYISRNIGASDIIYDDIFHSLHTPSSHHD